MEDAYLGVLRSHAATVVRISSELRLEIRDNVVSHIVQHIFLQSGNVGNTSVKEGTFQISDHTQVQGLGQLISTNITIYTGLTSIM